MDQAGKTSSTHPDALHVVPEGHEIVGILSGSALEATDRDVFLFWLGLGFFPVKLNCVPFFDGESTFGTDTNAVAHTITEFFGYDFCFSVDYLNGAFSTGCNAFSTACAFFFIDFYN